jgi:GAF domain-containing protein
MNDPEIRKTNEEIARKFRGIEAGLAVCRGIGELFERLILGSEEAFGVLKPLRKSDILRDRINIIAPAPFLEILPDVAHPLLASGDLRPFFRLMPPNVKYFLRSLAIAPLTRHDCLIGSLNHGDASPDRYRPGMETALLDHLARTVSEQLSRLLPPEKPAS